MSQFRSLYHFTSPEIADRIRSVGFMDGKEKGARPDAVFFTSDPESDYAAAFGVGVVEVSIPSELFDEETGEFAGPQGGWLDDEFPSGEQHWAIPARLIHRDWIKQ